MIYVFVPLWFIPDHKEVWGWRWWWWWYALSVVCHSFNTHSCKWLLGKSLYRCSHFTLNALGSKQPSLFGSVVIVTELRHTFSYRLFHFACSSLYLMQFLKLKQNINIASLFGAASIARTMTVRFCRICQYIWELIDWYMENYIIFRACHYSPVCEHFFYSSYRIHNFLLFWWFYPIYELKYKVSMHTKFFSCLKVCRTMRKLTHFWTSLTNPNKNFMWSTNIDTFEAITVTKIKRNKTKKKHKN